MEHSVTPSKWNILFAKHGIKETVDLFRAVQANPKIFNDPSVENDSDDYVIAIDFEAAGGIPEKNGFLSLGATLYSITQQKEISYFYQWANMKGYEWDKRCVEEFWMKHPQLFEMAKRNSSLSIYSPYDVIENFMEWVLVRVFIGPYKKTYLISDNVKCYVALVRYFSKERDIGYMFTNASNSFVYRDIIDTGSFYLGLGHCYLSSETLDTLSTKEIAKRVILNGEYEEKQDRVAHDCLDDAREIARLYCAVQSRLKK